MNRTVIEWTNRTCNPLGQGCDHNCWFCYAKRGARRNYFMQLGLYNKGKRKNPPCELCRDFKPHFHPERLDDPDFEHLKEGTKIFMCSTADLWAPWTLPEWRLKILWKIMDVKYRHLIFQVLTKNPERIPVASYGHNLWIGATVTSQADVGNLDYLRENVHGALIFVSFEPLLASIFCNLSGIDWIIIGKLTGSRKIPLQKEWVQSLIDQARSRKIPVFVKNNVGWPEKIQEYPVSHYMIWK